ncbi:hypothetical protein CUMW_232660, partial [Citrus unshiu]
YFIRLRGKTSKNNEKNKAKLRLIYHREDTWRRSRRCITVASQYVPFFGSESERGEHCRPAITGDDINSAATIKDNISLVIKKEYNNLI